MYEVGRNRLFYLSNDPIEQIVELYIRRPNLEWSNKIDMIFLEDGHYYADVIFLQPGSHIMRVFENGVKRLEEILCVSPRKDRFFVEYLET